MFEVTLNVAVPAVASNDSDVLLTDSVAEVEYCTILVVADVILSELTFTVPVRLFTEVFAEQVNVALYIYSAVFPGSPLIAVPLVIVVQEVPLFDEISSFDNVAVSSLIGSGVYSTVSFAEFDEPEILNVVTVAAKCTGDPTWSARINSGLPVCVTDMVFLRVGYVVVSFAATVIVVLLDALPVIAEQVTVTVLLLEPCSGSN